MSPGYQCRALFSTGRRLLNQTSGLLQNGLKPNILARPYRGVRAGRNKQRHIGVRCTSRDIGDSQHLAVNVNNLVYVQHVPSCDSVSSNVPSDNHITALITNRYNEQKTNDAEGTNENNLTKVVTDKYGLPNILNAKIGRAHV